MAGKFNGDLIATKGSGLQGNDSSASGLNYQQNMKGRKLALVVLGTPNKTRVLASIMHILKAVNEAEGGSYTFVHIGYERHKEPFR